MFKPFYNYQKSAKKFENRPFMIKNLKATKIAYHKSRREHKHKVC